MNGATQPLQIGVVGCGYWGSKHVRVLASIPGIEVSLIDRDETQRNAMANSYPVKYSAASLEEVLDKLDAIVIATPPTSHYSLAKQALQAGVHALVEKPLTTNVERAVELLELADRRGLCLMVGHTFEFNPAVWSLADAINEPEFGKVRYINSARLNLGLYQQDVDVLWDLAPHDISILNYILGSRPSSVSSWGLKLMADRSDVAYLSLRYDELDVSANIHVSWLDPMKVRRTTVVGENRMAVYDDMAEERIRIYEKGVKAEGQSGTVQAEVPMSYRHGPIVSPFVDFKEPLRLELEAFKTAIETNSRPATDGRSGLDVVAVLCAAEVSDRTGQWVPVSYGDEPSIDLREPDACSVDDRVLSGVAQTSAFGVNEGAI